MYKHIEFVCSGNNGRSPVAEAVAKDMLGILGFGDNAHVTSSGTLVDRLPQDSDELRNLLEPLIEKAIARGILGSEARQTLETNPQAVADKLRKNEMIMRNDYLHSSIGHSLFDHIPIQTVYRSDAELILPMDKTNLDRVVLLYGPQKRQDDLPKIMTLGEFSGLDLNLEQDFPESREEYMKTAAKVEAATRAAILRAVGYI